MSCWEEQVKRQQMNREILMRYNLSQKILISTFFFCLANFKAKLWPQTSLVCTFFHLNSALSLNLFSCLILLEISSYSECLVGKKRIKQSVVLKQILYHLLLKSDYISKYQTHSEGRTDKEKLLGMHKSCDPFAQWSCKQHTFQQWRLLFTGYQQPPVFAANLH